MKKILFVFFVFCLMSCKKNHETNQSCSLDLSLLKDAVWYPVPGNPFTNVLYASNGGYFENGQNKGTWNSINNCDSIRIVKNGNPWSMKILKLTQDSMTIKYPDFPISLDFFK